jgi:hypothetical protein
MLSMTNANTELTSPANKDAISLMLFNITYVNTCKNEENLTLTYQWFSTKCEWNTSFSLGFHGGGQSRKM